MKLTIFCPFGLKTPIHAPTNGGGISPPKWGAISTKPPKGTSLRESASFEPSSIKIRQRVSPVGEFMKKGIKKYFRYISPFPRSPSGRICTKFGRAVGVADVITSNKFFGDWSRGVDSVGVKNCPLPLTKPVAVNTFLLEFLPSAARDKILLSLMR